MAARLSADRRAELLKELRQHELHSLKAICHRHGISRATLWRLRDELRAQLKQNDSDNQAALVSNTAHEDC